jgi:hypothetical protein
MWVPTTQLVKFVRETEGKHELSYEHALGVWHQTKPLDVSIAPEIIGRTLDAVSADVRAMYQRTGLGRLAVNSSTHMADLLDGRLRARLAMILGITFSPIRVEYLPGGDRYRNIRHLALYQAIEVWREPPSMSATARLRMVNVKGVPVTLRKQWASVAQECSDIRLEQVKKFKTGYWMTTWNLNDLLVAFGVGMAFHETLAADQCVLAIRNSPLGALRCALVNNQGSRQSGQHWISMAWRRSESGANVRLVDPLGSRRLCRNVMDLLTQEGYAIHPFDARKRQRRVGPAGMRASSAPGDFLSVTTTHLWVTFPCVKCPSSSPDLCGRSSLPTP